MPIAQVGKTELPIGNSTISDSLTSNVSLSTTNLAASLEQSSRGSAATSQQTRATLDISESANLLSIAIAKRSSVSVSDQLAGKVSMALAKLGQSAMGIANLGGISATDSARFGGAVSNGV